MSLEFENLTPYHLAIEQRIADPKLQKELGDTYQYLQKVNLNDADRFLQALDNIGQRSRQIREWELAGGTGIINSEIYGQYTARLTALGSGELVTAESLASEIIAAGFVDLEDQITREKVMDEIIAGWDSERGSKGIWSRFKSAVSKFNPFGKAGKTQIAAALTAPFLLMQSCDYAPQIRMPENPFTAGTSKADQKILGADSFVVIEESDWDKYLGNGNYIYTFEHEDFMFGGKSSLLSSKYGGKVAALAMDKYREFMGEKKKAFNPFNQEDFAEYKQISQDSGLSGQHFRDIYKAIGKRTIEDTHRHYQVADLDQSPFSKVDYPDGSFDIMVDHTYLDRLSGKVEKTELYIPKVKVVLDEPGYLSPDAKG